MFCIDGVPVGKVRASEEHATHIGEEGVGVCPLRAIAGGLFRLEFLGAASCARELTQRNTEERVGSQEVNYGQTSLVDASLEKLVLWRPDVGVGCYPTAEKNGDGARPEDVEGAPVLAGLHSSRTRFGVGRSQSYLSQQRCRLV